MRRNQDYAAAQPEIVIRARDIHRAEAALALFMDSLQLLFGPPIWDVNLIPIPKDDHERNELRAMLHVGSTMFSAGRTQRERSRQGIWF
jgi:hypothetical protein